jgi:glycerol-3-phosphate dehydrogenase
VTPGHAPEEVPLGTTHGTPGTLQGRIRVGLADLPESTDVLVIGLGITGAGVALDAASRGLDVVAVDAEDVAFGTSRWSSKLVHGGLRYLAKGQLDVAHESAVERGILMQATAPHLVHALPMLMPLTPAISRQQAGLARAGIRAGDLLRLAARTRRETLPRPRRIGVTETLTLAPVVRRTGLRGAILSWDGQLEDDVRLVLAVARTAAAKGARVHTRVRVSEPVGDGAILTDARTGASRPIRARAVINATGVWAGQLVPEIRLRPSRGTHIVLRKDTLPGVRCAVMAPVPGATNRYVFALPQPDQTFYVGLTDEEVAGRIPDVPQPPEEDIEFLLGVINSALQQAVRRDQVIGAYAGLRPLLDTGTTTADLSRRHAVLVSSSGVVTVVGGKLTTYRQMAQDAVDRAVREARLEAGPCRTKVLPLVGAAPHEELAALDAPARLVRRFGTEAAAVLADAVAVTGLRADELLAPIAPTLPATLAEFVFGITHEGATTVDDLLDRRTRIGLVPEDRELARPTAERALALVRGREGPG